METVNIFSAENPGRIDVARAVGSTAYEMFVYDVPPAQSSSPYHYEFEERQDRRLARRREQRPGLQARHRGALVGGEDG